MNNTELSKRDQCVAIIKEMAKEIKLPREAMKDLQHLDLSMATDEQVDVMYNGLLQIKDTFKEAQKMNGGKSIFQSIKELQN